MALSSLPLFNIGYNWDDGTWSAQVREGLSILAQRTGYELEMDAQESLSDLRKMLVASPGGDVKAVLKAWENDLG